MATRTISLNLPENLYEAIHKMAGLNQRSIETELIELISSEYEVGDELPRYLVKATAKLEFLDDLALEKLAKYPLPKKVSKKIEYLHLKRGAEGLDEEEVKLLAYLMTQYDKGLLVRANSIDILRQRGHDIRKFISSPRDS